MNTLTAQFETVYYITVLSNFARGYDKYRRVYSKNGIPESTYPDLFFVLAESELEIGVRKATLLLSKLQLPGNRLIALQARVPSATLQSNSMSGLGRIYPANDLPIHAVFDLMTNEHQPKLVTALLEDIVADSYRLLATEMIDYEQLRPRSVSILPVARGCQAACPFCFSEASVSADQEQQKPDLLKIGSILRHARQRGAERAVITGGGEPALLKDDQLCQLISACAYEFSKVVLITNGYRHSRLKKDERAASLVALATAGLTVLNVSRHHHANEINQSLMNLDTQSVNLAETWRERHADFPRLRFRFTCVLQQGGIADAQAVHDYVSWAAGLGVPEICFKELYVSTSRESVYHSLATNNWAAQHQVPLSVVVDFAKDHGFNEIARLPWGAPVFRGQIDGHDITVAAYTEPSLFWERTHGIARSWNVMADGTCLASLEDRASEMMPKTYELR
ncbi:MAG TPA: radical SAM protein [Candidatus Acidoferrum sp.]|nr:radical SAM protein [Candidatus Acidoferrum sp.]